GRLRFDGDAMEDDNGDRVTFNNVSRQGRRTNQTGTAPPGAPIDPDNPNAPDNRLFEYRQPIVGMSGSVLGYNNGANTQEGEPDHASGLNDVSADHSVWWTWQAPDTERMLFSATSSKIDSVVNVYRGT